MSNKASPILLSLAPQAVLGSIGKSLVNFVLIASLLWLIGCGKKDAAPASSENTLPEAVAVQKAFESAAPSFRNPVNQLLNLVKAGQIQRDAYAEAIPQLHTIATNPLITPEQKGALEALIKRLQAELSPRK